MDTKFVRDVMLPLEEYAVVTEDVTLMDAILALEKAQKKLMPGRQPHRAVLVVDKRQNVVGKLGHLGFLKALEPKYRNLGDLQTLSRAGVSTEFLTSMMKDFRFWKDGLSDIRRRARSIIIRDVMHPVTESIDENAPLTEALHKIIMWQVLSCLVTSRDKIVGILRLSDLFDEIARSMKETTDDIDKA